MPFDRWKGGSHLVICLRGGLRSGPQSQQVQPLGNGKPTWKVMSSSVHLVIFRVSSDLACFLFLWLRHPGMEEHKVDRMTRRIVLGVSVSTEDKLSLALGNETLTQDGRVGRPSGLYG